MRDVPIRTGDPSPPALVALGARWTSPISVQVRSGVDQVSELHQGISFIREELIDLKSNG